MLRFVSVPAAERVHGGKSTSRDLPPAAFWERGTGTMAAVPQKGILKGLDPIGEHLREKGRKKKFIGSQSVVR